MSVVIKAEGLSKEYVICHEAQGSYATLVDSLTRTAKDAFSKIAQPFKKRDSGQKRTYEEFWALKDVNFECRQGERLAIIGKNGAGKSTLLKILSRIIEPSKGSVKITGRLSSLLEVGTGFHPELTGRENIFLNGAILGMDRREMLKKFDEIVSFSEISQFLDTPVKYYSSGMYARLGFAIAAHLDPDILIVDEVLAVGDAAFQQKCLAKLDDVSQSGRTILFVSHNTQAMMALCNKGLYLANGQVQCIGAIDQCINAYLQEVKKTTFEWTGSAGNDAFKIYSLAVAHTRDFFYTDETAYLTLSCEVFRPLQEEVLGIGIKNSRFQTILSSMLTQDPAIRAALKVPGRYTFTLAIGLNGFWEGEYTFTFAYFIPDKKKILGDEITLKFPIYKNNPAETYRDSNHMEGMLLTTPWQVLEGHSATAYQTPIELIRPSHVESHSH